MSSSDTALIGGAMIYDESAPSGTLFQFRRQDNKIGFGRWLSSVWDQLLSNDITWGAGVWHYVVATWTSSSKKIYIDGVLSASNTSSGATNGVVASSWLGRIGQGTSHLDGNLAVFQVYNRPISLEEVKQNCLAQAGRFTNSPVNICGTP